MSDSPSPRVPLTEAGKRPAGMVEIEPLSVWRDRFDGTEKTFAKPVLTKGDVTLTNDEISAIMSAVVRELPALTSATAYQTVAAVLAAHEAVPSLAARLAAATALATEREAGEARYKLMRPDGTRWGDNDYTQGEAIALSSQVASMGLALTIVPVSPAPVASPERDRLATPQTQSIVDLGPLRSYVDAAPPVGAWMTMEGALADEDIAVVEQVENEYPIGGRLVSTTRIKRWMDEAKVQRNYATEQFRRAEEAERESNRLAFEADRAKRDRNRAQDREAAALKLAREAIGLATGMRDGVFTAKRVDENVDDLRARLAALGVATDG